jgi:hypothetical protein
LYVLLNSGQGLRQMCISASLLAWIAFNLVAAIISFPVCMRLFSLVLEFVQLL